MSNEKEYARDEFMIKETLNIRIPLELESAIYVAVSEGNMEKTREICENNSIIDMKGAGVLSDNRLQNIRYHFVIGTAIIARFCIQNGMLQDTAYSLSDYYIKKMDSLKKEREIDSLHKEMCYAYCERMTKMSRDHIISRSISKCLDYINANIHSAVSLNDLAKVSGLSECYLSRLFAKEMGVCVHEYILSLKIDRAKNLLSYSDYSITDIANFLSFSSQSHFISSFRKHVGITPNKYRNSNFKKM